MAGGRIHGSQDLCLGLREDSPGSANDNRGGGGGEMTQQHRSETVQRRSANSSQALPYSSAR